MKRKPGKGTTVSMRPIRTENGYRIRGLFC